MFVPIWKSVKSKKKKKIVSKKIFIPKRNSSKKQKKLLKKNIFVKKMVFFIKKHVKMTLYETKRNIYKKKDPKK